MIDLIQNSLLIGVGAVVAGFASILKEKWKGSNTSKELDIRKDQQEVDQAISLAPVWQSIVDNLQAQNTEMRSELKSLRERLEGMGKSQSRMEVEMARQEGQIELLKLQLNAATQKHSRDDETIRELSASMEDLRDQLEDSRSNLIRMGRDRDRYRELWHHAAPDSAEEDHPFLPPDWEA